jgi:hypothetical protein
VLRNESFGQSPTPLLQFLLRMSYSAAMHFLRSLLVLVCTLSASMGSHAADFAVRDGDTVVFLGDSITAARGYSKIIEDYTLLRFPDRQMKSARRANEVNRVSESFAGH